MHISLIVTKTNKLIKITLELISETNQY